MVLSVPPSIAGNYSERIQNMLGYNIIEPSFMGYVDGVHPRKLINSEFMASGRFRVITPTWSVTS